MTVRFVLYGTEHCHLCDSAKSLLRKADITFEYVDIAQSEQFITAYGTRIPVLQRLDTMAELGWPFDENLLIGFSN